MLESKTSKKVKNYGIYTCFAVIVVVYYPRGKPHKERIMGKVLVQYYSESGNTQQMSTLVAKGAALMEDIYIRLKTIESCTAENGL
jgi:hypothetical protein